MSVPKLKAAKCIRLHVYTCQTLHRMKYQTNQTPIHWLLIQSGCKQSWVGYGWITTWTCVTCVNSTLRPFVPRTSGGSGALLKSWNCMKFRVFFFGRKESNFGEKKRFQKKKNLHFMTLCISARISALWFAIGFATLNLNFAKSRWLRDAKRLRQKVNEVPGAK